MAAPVFQLPVNNQTIDLTQYVSTAVDNLSNQYTGLFLGTVQPYLFPALVVGLVIAGMYWLFDYPHRAMQYLWGTLLSYAVVQFILRYYSAPMPLVGIPFSQIFRLEGRFLAAKIDIGILNVFLAQVNQMFQSGGQPHAFNIFQTMGYYLIMIAMALPEIVLFLETSFAIVGLGIGALLGPIFIALYMFPFRWSRGLFWGWVHAMIKYALYRVFASALVFIWATADMGFLNGLFGGHYNLASGIAALLGLIVFQAACALLCLRLPHLVSDFTSGGASGGGGMIQGVAGVVAGAKTFGI